MSILHSLRQSLITRQTGFFLAAFVEMAVEAFAVFFNGAYFLGPMTLCVVSTWLIFITSMFLRRDDFLPFRAISTAPALLLASLWVWAGISFLWSIASDLTWVEFNRTGGYLAVFLLGYLIGGNRRAVSISAWLFLQITAGASVYALGTKVMPQIVENADNLGRISVPVGYVNAMGLLVALGMPLSLYYSAAKGINAIQRLLALVSAQLLLICLFFTLSRGAFLALILGLAVYFTLVPYRLRSFFILLLAGIPSMLIAWWSTGQDALMKDHVELGLRMGASGQLLDYLIAVIIPAAACFLIMLLAGRFVKVPRLAARITGGFILAVILISSVIGAALFVSSKPAFGKWASDAYTDFTQGVPAGNGAGRLFEIGSSGRWQLWEEASASWGERPLIGSGGQTFPVLHMLHRETPVFVKQPHGLPFRLLSELGLVGFILGGAFICMSLALSMLGWYRTSKRIDKGMAGVLIAVMVTYLAHTAYDWDWNIFALTMPYMFFAGITVGWAGQLARTHRKNGA